MSDRSDYAVGERVKVGCYADKGVYRAFRNWVEAQTGKQYAEVGRALERAMLEYMDDDRIQDQLGDIDAQTRKNEALLRQVLTQLDGDTDERKRRNSNSVPQGKSPGARKRRELLVIQALCQMDGKKFNRETITEAVREVAEVSSDKTIQSYLEAITDSQAFIPASGVGQWHLDRDAAYDLLTEYGIEVPTEL